MKSSVSGPEGKAFGIAVTLPEGDPMAQPHLLGDEWSGTRWFATAEERDAMGIPESLIRYSAGIESPDDLLADLEQALKAFV